VLRDLPIPAPISRVRPMSGSTASGSQRAGARLLPELLRLNDAQAALGTGTHGWPDLITRTLTSGGDGYCLHSTLQARPDTRDLLRVLRRIGDRCCPAIRPAATSSTTTSPRPTWCPTAPRSPA
jgi:hypothetical protein